MKAAPATRSGASRASSSRYWAPRERLTITARSVPVASITARQSRANSAGSVAPRVAAAVGAPVAEAVHRQHPEVAREVGDLHLPVARVDQRPGREQEDGLLALAVDLVEEPLAVALDEALGVGVAGAALLAVAADRSAARLRCDRELPAIVLHRLPCSSEASQPSIAAQQLGVTAVEAEQALEQQALVELHHQRRPGLRREAGAVEAVLLDRLGERVAEQRAPARR